jgi:hypothetical protein
VLLTEAGFGAIEIEDTGVGYLGCVHARVDGCVPGSTSTETPMRWSSECRRP